MRGNEGAGGGVYIFKDVETEGVALVGWIDKDGVVGAVAGNEIEEGGYEGAVGVYDAQAVVVADVLDGEVSKERGLSHTCFSNDVGVEKAVVLFDAEGAAIRAD